MTQEERDILLKDLSARLPYGVKCKHDKAGVGTLINVLSNGHITIDLSYFGYNLYSIADIETVKSYLFPLSSMTEEQIRDYKIAARTKIALLNKHSIVTENLENRWYIYS